MKLIGVILTLVFTAGISVSSNEVALAAPLTATFLEVPASEPTLIRGQSPFIVRFDGGLAANSSNCGAFGAEAQIVFRWSTSQETLSDSFSSSVPGLRSYDEGNYYKTLAVTATGLTCEIGHVAGWGNGDLYNSYAGQPGPIYRFMRNEASTNLTLVALSNSIEIGRANGLLNNPAYFPYSATFSGITRGDHVGQVFALAVTGDLPKPDQITKQSLTVNGKPCLGDTGTGEVCIAKGGPYNFTILINFGGENPAPSNLTIGMTIEATNQFGFTNALVIPPVTLIWDSNSRNPEMSDLTNSGLFLHTLTRCENKSERTGVKLNCSTYATVTTRPNAYESPGDFATTLPMQIQYWADSRGWKYLRSVTMATDVYNKFSFKAPKNNSYLAIRVVNPSFIKMGQATEQYFGRKPGDYNIVLTLPKQIFWGKTFTIKATPTGGKATSCVFYDAGGTTIIARGVVKNGHVTTRAKLFWPGSIGSGTSIKVWVECKFGRRKYMDRDYTIGLR